MNSAYYANKIPEYKADLKSGDRIPATFYEIRETLLSDIQKYNVKQVFAHNMRFDYGSLNNTQRWLTKSKYRYFFPKTVDICDTLKLSRQLIATMPTYKKYCKENGYQTKIISHDLPQKLFIALLVEMKILKRNTKDYKTV